MKLQFFHVEDLCKFIDIILEKQPDEHIFNVGNTECVSINQLVKLCYDIVGKELKTEYVDETHTQRDYFCFHDYEYELDLTKQTKLLPYTKPLETGLKEAYEWYKNHQNEVNKKPYFEYIDKNFK